MCALPSPSTTPMPWRSRISRAFPVIGTAWQGQAAQVLQAEAGIPSMTTARLLNQLMRGQRPIPEGAVVVVDEAAVMPTRALAELTEEVAARGGRMILVGDRDQLPPIDAGGAFASLADRLGVAELTENRRQRDDLQRQVARLLADGHAPEVLALLAERGRFEPYGHAHDARAALIDAWAETSLETPERALILAHDRRDVRALNQLARERLNAAGRLGTTRMVAHGRQWATGDRLLCRRNNYRKDVDVRNGTRGTVLEPDPARGDLRIRTDDGRTVTLPADYLQHVEYGYASTGHTSQGATVDRTFLLATPARGGREWGYVAGTRHRVDLRVYTVHFDFTQAQRELEKTWQRSQAKALAIDRMPGELRDRALVRFQRRELQHEIERRRREEWTPPPLSQEPPGPPVPRRRRRHDREEPRRERDTPERESERPGRDDLGRDEGDDRSL